MNRAAAARAIFDQPWHRIGLSLLGLKARSTRNRLVLTRRKDPAKIFLQFAIVAPAIAGLIALLAAGFSSTLDGITDEALSTTILGSMIAIFWLGAFIGSSTTALQALYLADDIPFLLTLPVPLRALFGGKFVEASVGALPSGILFVAVALGYGIVHAGHLLYWVVSLVAGFAIATIATTASVVTVSLVTRFIPAHRARLFLFGITFVVVGCTAVAWRLLVPSPQTVTDAVDRGQYEPLWNVLAWTPVGWCAQAMTEAGTGSAIGAIVLMALLVISGALAVAISYDVFRRTFLRGLAQTKAVQTTEPNQAVARWMRYAASLMPRRLGAVVLKEWLVLFRDLRRLSGAIWPVGIVLIYTVVLGRQSGMALGSGDLEFWSRNGSLALLPWGLSLGISVYSIGSEGRNVHFLRSLPMSASRVFAAKVLASLLPVALLSLGAATLSLWLRDAPLLQAVELLGLIARMVVGYVVIDTAAAAVAPNFETDQVQRTIGLTGRLFSFALGSLFGITTLAAAARLILMTSEPPDSIVDILTIDASGFELFGWPLIAVGFGIAVTVVWLSVSIAIRETERLIRSGA